VTTWQTTVAPGREVDSFHGLANKAERIWNALERSDLEAVAVHYPAAYPSDMKQSY
jgi:hypothetical protein